MLAGSSCAAGWGQALVTLSLHTFGGRTFIMQLTAHPVSTVVFNHFCGIHSCCYSCCHALEKHLALQLFTPTRLALARSDALIAICRRQHAKLLVPRIRAATSTLPLSMPHPADLAQQLSWASGSRISSATCTHSFCSGAAWIDSQFRARREQGSHYWHPLGA